MKSISGKRWSSNGKTLSRKEKLKLVRKANQELLKALALMASDNETHALSSKIPRSIEIRGLGQDLIVCNSEEA
jgi:hypothetical protein